MDNISILIVEDEAIVAKDLASKIGKMGYSVAGITATGEEAIELACQKRPALVLMDIRLAGAMDGIVAAQQIYRDCNLPILFLSANSDMATVKHTQLEGAFGYILKPFDDRDLEIQIEMALYKHSTQQQLKDYSLELQREIAERKQVEEALRESEKQLLVMNNELELRVEQRTQELQETQRQYLHAEKLAAIGKLSASIAHEVNNPLQSILTILKGLSGQTLLEEMDLKLIRIAIGEGDRIKGLIRSLQDFYRPSTGRKTLLDVNSTLDLLLLLQKSDFKGKRILLELNYAERLPMISVVADQIKQVFLNLLTNAKEACLQGGTITISTRQDGSKVAVAIKDTGVGIKPEQMEHIFRPFYSTKPEVKGIGLGLSVSYGIVKKHGGEILVESKPGEGATFVVLLPINEETVFEDLVL